MPAPLGYIDCGKGQVKTVDPEESALVRAAFQLYATGTFSLDELTKEMFSRGLRSRNGNRRFYIGEIEIKKTGDRFLGGHEPIIAPSVVPLAHVSRCSTLTAFNPFHEPPPKDSGSLKRDPRPFQPPWTRQYHRGLSELPSAAWGP